MKMLKTFVLLATITLGLASCSSDSSSDGAAETDPSTGGSGEIGDASADGAPSSLFSAADFEPACRGIGVAAASEYVADDGLNHIVALVGEDPSYEGLYSSALADGWEAEFEEIDSTELVVCLNRVETTSGELCEGFEDEGLEWSVQMNGGTYDVSLRAAMTGDIIAETTLEAPAGDCPVFSSYSEGDPTPVMQFTTPDDALQAWLGEYVGS